MATQPFGADPTTGQLPSVVETRVAGLAPVQSVNGKTGGVNLAPSDIGAATAAQGALAQTAVQPGSLAPVATSGTYSSLTGTPTLGTAAAQPVSAFATSAQGIKADSAVQPAALTTALTSKTDELTDTASSSATPTATLGQRLIATGAGAVIAGPAVGSATTPPQRWSVRNESGGTQTLNTLDATGTAAAITILPGEVLTFRQVGTVGFRGESGNKPLSALDGRYTNKLKNFAVPAATGVATTDDANIRATIAAAVAAGGGTVQFQDGTYKLLAKITPQSGVHLVGVRPQLIQTNKLVSTGWLADGGFTYVAGTRLQGDGTFPAIAGNETPQASVADNQGDATIQHFEVRNFVLDNFTYGIQIGATNIMGAAWATFDEIYASNCSIWGVAFTNVAHIKFGRITTYLCANGQLYSTAMPRSTFMPGNSHFNDLYHWSSGKFLGRGIVFEASTVNASIGQIIGQRVQSNCFNRTQLSVAATVTSGNTSITVPDGTKFAVGLPVTVAATNYGFTANYTYMVQSVSGNTITLGNSKSTAAISPTGSGTTTITSWGMPCIEIAGAAASASAASVRYHQLDAEGQSQAGIYVENILTSYFEVVSIPGSGTSIVARNMATSTMRSQFNASTDFDGNCGTSEYLGQRGTTIQRPIRGMWRDGTIQTTVISFQTGGAGQVGGELHTRANGFIYPNSSGIGEHLFVRTSSQTLTGAYCGKVVCEGATATTLTLPTIVDDATPATSHVGLYFDVCNVGAGTVTVTTDGTQLVNRIAGRTTLTIAAGQASKIYAVKGADGTLYWLADSPRTLAT